MSDITGEEFGERTKYALRSHNDGWVVIADALTYIGELEEANADLRKANELRKNLNEELTNKNIELSEQLSAAEQDARRWKRFNTSVEWIRNSDEGYSYLLLRLPFHADLSCVAMRNAAIDAALPEVKQ